MHLVDSNVWIALSLKDHVHHNAVKDWFASISDPASLHFCRMTQLSFLRLATTASVFALYGDPPATNVEAWGGFETLLADDRIVLREQEPKGIEPRLKEFSARTNASPKLWMDAYLAAFAVTGGYQLVTTDAAFTQFPGLDLLLLGS